MNNVQDWTNADDNTNAVLILNGKLASYANNSVAIYKCPSDKTLADNGPRLRSVSMNSLVGDPGILTNKFNPDYVQCFQSGDVRHPSETFVFIDEHPDTLNDGFFMNRLEEYKWGNLPASSHNGAGNLSYTDGHADTHRWVVTGTGGTVRPVTRGGVGGTFDATPRTDFEWLKQHTTVKK